MAIVWRKICPSSTVTTVKCSCGFNTNSLMGPVRAAEAKKSPVLIQINGCC